jgi:predicted RNA-binding Zn-ribbon protein involved in translation (DUF1610 family)
MLPKSSDKFYTPAQAMERLGVNRKRLENYVIAGRLTKQIPPGQTRGVFLREEVDDLAREIEAWLAASAAPPAHFMKGTPADMQECAQLVKSIFGVAPNPERRAGWIQSNPDVCYVVRVAEKIVGVAFLLPLKLERIEHIWSEEHTSPILPDDVQCFKSGQPIHLYALSMCVHPGSLTNKRQWGARLIKGIMETIVDFGWRGIVIEDIWARSEYPDGIALMQHMGMTEVPSTTQQRNFVIRVKESGIPLLMAYKTELARSQGKELPPRPPQRQKYPASTLCPECGDLDNPAIRTFERVGKSHHYKCTNCGYEADR